MTSPVTVLLRCACALSCASACTRAVEPSRDAGAPTSAFTTTVRVPAALRIARSLESLTVTFDPGALATVVLPVSAGTSVGMRVDTFVYPMGGTRPATGSTELMSPPGVDVTSLWNANDGIPAPGKRYAVDMEVTVFETDVPPGHHWMPESGRYRVLWTRTLHQTEE